MTPPALTDLQTMITGAPQPALWAAGAFTLVAVCVFLALGVRGGGGRRQGYEEEPDPRGSPYPSEVPEPGGPVPAFLADQRKSLRREGNPVEVLLKLNSAKAKPFVGYVLDRSTSGLKVFTESRVESGCTLQVRARNAPETFPWVAINVRRSQKLKRNLYELGCQFQDKKLPWNVLLTFG